VQLELIRSTAVIRSPAGEIGLSRRSVHDKQYQRILKQLVEARLEANISQEELARMIGSNQSHVSKIERGERRLDAVQLGEICRALKLSPATVLQHILKP